MFQRRLLLTPNKLNSLCEIPFEFRLIIAEGNQMKNCKSKTYNQRWLRNDCRRRKILTRRSNVIYIYYIPYDIPYDIPYMI